VAMSDKLEDLLKMATKTKKAWKTAQTEERKMRDTYQGAVKAAKGEMDAAWAQVSAAKQARNELLAEHTPTAMQQAETSTGYAYRLQAQARGRAENDVANQRQSVQAASQRKGFLRPDKETRRREHDKLVHLESVVAKMLSMEDALLAEWKAARQDLNAAMRAATNVGT